MYCLTFASSLLKTYLMNAFNRRMMQSSLNMKVSGKVKFFDTVKGFGFITPDDGSEDVFVHQTSIVAQGFRSLADGEPVEYEVSVDASKGGKKFATDVTGPNGNFVQGARREGGGDGGRERGGGGSGRDFGGTREGGRDFGGRDTGRDRY